MDMTDNKAMSEGFHGIHKDIPADGLYDILHKLGTVGFNAFPFFCATYALIGYGFSAESVFTHPGFHVRQPSAGGKCDKKHTALVSKMNAMSSCAGTLFDGSLDGIVYVPPELHDVGIGGTPQGDKGLKLIFG